MEMNLNNKNDFKTTFLQRVTCAEAVAEVVELAASYPYPHSILGKANAAEYVKELLSGRREHLKCSDTDGWYAVFDNAKVCAVCHLSIYGIGNGTNHTLWKVRHPMLRCGEDRAYLVELFNQVFQVAFAARPGSAKVMIFIGEEETDMQWSAGHAGFKEEGCFLDYYRLGECCFVYGKTITGVDGY